MLWKAAARAREKGQDVSAHDDLSAIEEDCYPAEFGGARTLADGTPIVKKPVPRQAAFEAAARRKAEVASERVAAEQKARADAAETTTKQVLRAAARAGDGLQRDAESAQSKAAAAQAEADEQARKRAAADAKAEIAEKLRKQAQAAAADAAKLAVAEKAARLEARRTAELEAAAEIERQKKLMQQKMEEALQRKGWDFGRIQRKVEVLEAGAKAQADAVKAQADAVTRQKRLKNAEAKRARKAE